MDCSIEKLSEGEGKLVRGSRCRRLDESEGVHAECARFCMLWVGDS